MSELRSALIGAVIAALLVTACAQANAAPTAEPNLKTPIAAFPSAVSTPTSRPATQPSAVGSISIVQPTPFPTLTPIQSSEIAIALLKTNAGCTLPCWWGVMPGQTSYQAAKDSFASLGLQLSSTNESQGGALGVPVRDTASALDYLIGVDFYVTSGVVAYIDVSGDIYRDKALPRFTADWEFYAWDQILKRYGHPSQIAIYFDPIIEPNAAYLYTLILTYDKQGFELTYTGPSQRGAAENLQRACPHFQQVSHVRIRTYPANTPRPPGADYTSPVMVTGVSQDTFFMTLQDPNSIQCFDQR